MADKAGRRPRWRRGRRPARESVVVDGNPFGDDSGDDGSAGVREPRRPKPKGPVSGAGVLPEPLPPIAAVLPDPRY